MTSFKNAPLEGVVRMELVATIMSRMQENYNYTICLSLIHQSSVVSQKTVTALMALVGG